MTAQTSWHRRAAKSLWLRQKGSEDLFFKVEIPEAATADRVFLFVNAWSCFLFFILFYAHTSGSAREFDTVLRTALPRKRKSCIRWLKMFCTPFMHPRVTPPVQKCNLVCGMFAILRVFSKCAFRRRWKSR